MSPSNAKVFNKKLTKRVFFLFFIVVFSSGYVEYVKKSTNEDMASELFKTSAAIVTKWIQYSFSVSWPVNNLDRAALSQMCIKECSALDIALQDTKIIKSNFVNMPMMNVSSGFFMTPNDEYVLAGYKVSSLYVNSAGTKIGVLFEGVDESLLAFMENHYDNAAYTPDNGLKGIVRYSKGDQEKPGAGFFFEVEDVIRAQEGF